MRTNKHLHAYEHACTHGVRCSGLVRLAWETGLTIVLRSKPIRGAQCARGIVVSANIIRRLLWVTLSLSCRECFPNEQ